MGKGRAPCCDKSKVKRGPWTPAEDFKLVSFIQEHGHPNWRALPSQAGLLRCGKSCRLRWINYLRPDVKRGNFTPKEEETLIKLHQAYGNKWSKIASFLPGRTDNEIKNVWNTHLKKRLGIKSNKRNTSKRTKSKKSPSAFVVESSSLKSSTSLSYNDQVDRDSKATPRSIDNKESPSPSLISCVSNISTNERSHVDLMDTNFDTPLEGLHPDDLGALDELDFWNIVDLDNLCSLQTDSLEGHPFKPLEESNSVGFGNTHYFTSDDMTHNWIRNLEIELGLDDIKK